MSNNQDENTTGKEKHMELTTNAPDIRQNQENVDVQFHSSDLDRNSPFIDDLQTNSHKNIESLEMETQVEIHNENSNHEIDTNISTQSDRDERMVTAVDGDLTVLKLSKFQPHTSLNEQVLYIML